MGIQGDWSSWRVQGSALVGVWGQSHHKAKVQEKSQNRKTHPCEAHKKTNEKIEDLRVDVTQINYDLSVQLLWLVLKMLLYDNF